MPGFDKASARRIAGIVRRIEQNPRNTTHRYDGPVIGWGGKVAQTSSAITAASGSTFGSGTAVLQLSVAGSVSALSHTVTVYNFGAALSTGKYIYIAPVDGEWHILSALC